jgi:hypothetical protein
LVFQAALCLASGRTVQGITPVDPCGVPILIIEEEGPAKPTANRWKWLAKGNGVDFAELPIHFMHRQGFTFQNDDALRQVQHYIMAHNIQLVVFDTYAKTNKGDENSSQHTGDVMRRIASLRETGATIMLVHHTRKRGEKQIGSHNDQLRGSSALIGYMDVHWALGKRSLNQPHLNLDIFSNEDEAKHYQVRWDIRREDESARLYMREGDGIDDNLGSLVNMLITVNMQGEPMGYTLDNLAEAWKVSVGEAKAQVAEMLGTYLRREGRFYYVIEEKK